MLKQLVGTSPTLEKAFAGEKLSLKDGLTLFEENEHVLGAAADIMRKNSVGDRVFSHNIGCSAKNVFVFFKQCQSIFK